MYVLWISTVVCHISITKVCTDLLFFPSKRNGVTDGNRGCLMPKACYLNPKTCYLNHIFPSLNRLNPPFLLVKSGFLLNATPSSRPARTLRVGELIDLEDGFCVGHEVISWSSILDMLGSRKPCSYQILFIYIYIYILYAIHIYIAYTCYLSILQNIHIYIYTRKTPVSPSAETA